MISYENHVGTHYDMHRVDTEFVRSICRDLHVKLDVLLAATQDKLSPCILEHYKGENGAMASSLVNQIRYEFHTKTGVAIKLDTIDADIRDEEGIEDHFIWYAEHIYQLTPEAQSIAKYIQEEWMSVEG